MTSFEIVGPYKLRVEFDDGASREIDFRPILAGELFGPLVELAVFNQVRLDEEAHTLVWPTGADLDPATLHDWSDLLPQLRAMAKRWEEMAIQR